MSGYCKTFIYYRERDGLNNYNVIGNPELSLPAMYNADGTNTMHSSNSLYSGVRNILKQNYYTLCLYSQYVLSPKNETPSSDAHTFMNLTSGNHSTFDCKTIRTYDSTSGNLAADKMFTRYMDNDIIKIKDTDKGLYIKAVTISPVITDISNDMSLINEGKTVKKNIKYQITDVYDNCGNVYDVIKGLITVTNVITALYSTGFADDNYVTVKIQLKYKKK